MNSNECTFMLWCGFLWMLFLLIVFAPRDHRMPHICEKYIQPSAHQPLEVERR